MTGGVGISYEEQQRLKELAKSVPINQVVARYVAIKRHGAEYKACCPFHAESTPSFTVVPAKDMYHCFGCGENGDGIGFVMAMDNIGFADAAAAICASFGLVPVGEQRMRVPPQPVSHEKARQQNQEVSARKAERMAELWKNAVPAYGTIVCDYLSSRGIRLGRWSEDLLRQLRYTRTDYFEELENGRFLSRGKFPVMVAPMQGRDGKIHALHLTYLAPHGAGKLNLLHSETGEKLPAKKMIGKPWGCAIRLGGAHACMAVAEGIETGLSFMMSAPTVPVWVAGTIGNMAGRGVGTGAPHPLREGQKLPSVHPDLAHPGIVMPPECREVVVIKDNDGKDQLAIDAQVDRACRRFYQRGMKVSVVTPPPGCDLNDVLMRGGHVTVA